MTSQNTIRVNWSDKKKDDIVNTVRNKADDIESISRDIENLRTQNNCTQQNINNIVDAISKYISINSQSHVQQKTI